MIPRTFVEHRPFTLDCSSISTEQIKEMWDILSNGRAELTEEIMKSILKSGKLSTRVAAISEDEEVRYLSTESWRSEGRPFSNYLLNFAKAEVSRHDGHITKVIVEMDETAPVTVGGYTLPKDLLDEFLSHSLVNSNENIFKSMNNGRDTYSESLVDDFLKQCNELPTHDSHCYAPPVELIWDDDLTAVISNTFNSSGQIESKGELMSLHSEYRSQHEAMCSQGSVCNTTRRQANFRPRGKVYQRLLKLELEWY